jgi:hypothetical protein
LLVHLFSLSVACTAFLWSGNIKLIWVANSTLSFQQIVLCTLLAIDYAKALHSPAADMQIDMNWLLFHYFSNRNSFRTGEAENSGLTIMVLQAMLSASTSIESVSIISPEEVLQAFLALVKKLVLEFVYTTISNQYIGVVQPK